MNIEECKNEGDSRTIDEDKRSCGAKNEIIVRFTFPQAPSQNRTKPRKTTRIGSDEQLSGHLPRIIHPSISAMMLYMQLTPVVYAARRLLANV